MKGVNLGGWFSQIDAIEQKDPKAFPGMMEHIQTFLGEADFKRIKDWGFDHVRVGMDWYNTFTPAIEEKKEVLDLYGKALDMAVKQGLRVILDLHRCPGHDFEAAIHGEQSFFTSADLRKDCLRVWAVLAERFGSIPGIILEPLNEPVAPDAETWNTVKAELAREIRRMAPKATLLIGANRWNTVDQFDFLTPIDDDNVIYSFHYYLPLLFTHQFAPWVPYKAFRKRYAYPGTYEIEPEEMRVTVQTGKWDKARMHAEMQPVFKFRERHQAQVMCNEWGVYMAGPDRVSQMNWIRDCLELFAENEVGWTYWNYKNLDFGLISVGEQLFADHPAYSNPDRADHEMIRLLTATKG